MKRHNGRIAGNLSDQRLAEAEDFPCMDRPDTGMHVPPAKKLPEDRVRWRGPMWTEDQERQRREIERAQKLDAHNAHVLRECEAERKAQAGVGARLAGEAA